MAVEWTLTVGQFVCLEEAVAAAVRYRLLFAICGRYCRKMDHFEEPSPALSQIPVFRILYNLVAEVLHSVVP
jgi:hypothetical protein